MNFLNKINDFLYDSRQLGPLRKTAEKNPQGGFCDKALLKDICFS